MRAGALRHTLIIQQASESRDSYGQAVISTWSTWLAVPGELWPIGGRERFLAAQTHAESNYRARIRWIEGLTTKHRISFEGRVFAITYIADDGRRRELVLDLVEGVSDG